MNIVDLTAKNIKEQSKIKKFDIIKKYFIEYAAHYIPPRACGRTLLKNKLILEEMEIEDETN